MNESTKSTIDQKPMSTDLIYGKTNYNTTTTATSYTQPPTTTTTATSYTQPITTTTTTSNLTGENNATGGTYISKESIPYGAAGLSSSSNTQGSLFTPTTSTPVTNTPVTSTTDTNANGALGSPNKPVSAISSAATAIADRTTNLSVNIEGITMNQVKIQSAASSLDTLWRAIQAQISAIDESWVGQDAKVYTDKLSKMSPKIEAAVNSLKAIDRTYEKALNEIQENQKRVINDI